MKTLMRLLTVISTALLLASCGGGGGCAGTPTNGTNTCTSGGTAAAGTAPAVARFVYTLDKASITNSGTDEALLTMTALDASNNVISGVPVNVTVSSGAYVPTKNPTDSAGQAQGKIQIGGDYSNRIITATFTDGNGTVGVASIAVTGAAISVQALPAAPAPGSTVTVTLKATNINGQAIGSQSIQLSGMGYAGGPLTTGPTGSATATITAPAAGSYTLTATGLGVTASQPVVVVGGGGGTIPNAVGTISGANISINPNTIGPNTPNSTTSRAALKVLFKDAANLAIQYVRVRFDITQASGSVGEQISTGTSLVYSDASGVATADYIAGTTTSPTNGVIIRACYDYADFAVGTCPNSVTNTMTVAGQALSISLGSNNTLGTTNQGLTYVKTLVVTVNDAAGLAVAGAGVSASVDITHYAKGYVYNDPDYVLDPATSSYVQLFAPPKINVLNDATGLPLAPNTAVTPVVKGRRIWCVNEDYNRNGLLDTSVGATAPAKEFPTGKEDVNNSGIVEPRKADVTVSYVNGQTSTGADGTLLLKVQYPQNVATWLAYTVKVSTAVGGTEGKDEKSFFTEFLISDEPNGSFRTPLNGYGTCQDNF